MFKKILIANRGEIALRVIRACREIGITSAVVYSTADRKSLPVLLADEAYFIGEAPSRDSYLNIPAILQALKDSKADALHPGYGFLSENVELAKALEKNRVTLIGPSAHSIEVMGDKIKAKQIMEKNGVPTVPGSNAPIKDLKHLKAVCKDIGFPIMLKVALGGGGKGMRVVHHPDDLELSYQSAKSEATNYFADETLYVEKFIQNPKHIEIQVIADKHQNVICLYERECSVQRRHQKLIEEAPSIALPQEVREKMRQIVTQTTQSIKYLGVGTFEFIFDNKTKEFFFMEMNTRLQVEHPVTEMVTGFDLVKEQISVAEGHPLSFQQKDVQMKGHAIEVRICGEDSQTCLPSPGHIKACHLPQGPFIRVDSYIDSDYTLPIDYDPLIAKLIAWGRNRREAIARLQRALAEVHIAGIKTNVQFLSSILKTKSFEDGSYTTQLLNQNVNTETIESIDDRVVLITAAIEAYQNAKHKYLKKPEDSQWKFKGRLESFRWEHHVF